MSRIDDYWASFFGLSVSDFIKDNLKVVPHAQLQGYSGAWLFRRNSSLIISVPSDWVKKIESQVSQQESKSLSDQNFVELFGESVKKVIGPAYQGYLEEADFRSIPSTARRLWEADDLELRKFITACDSEEVENSTVEEKNCPRFGIFAGHCLAAVANYQVVNNNAAMPGILTHPKYRGQGYGKAVLSCATEHALNQKHLMLYQTLVANKASIGTTESLGYRQYAEHLAVRLHKLN